MAAVAFPSYAWMRMVWADSTFIYIILFSMKTGWTILCFMLVLVPSLRAQEKSKTNPEYGLTVTLPSDSTKKDPEKGDPPKKTLEFSAYFNGQFQYAQKDVRRVSVGAPNENYGEKEFSRIGVRRAFFTTVFQTGIAKAYLTIEARDNQRIWFSDAFIELTDPWTKRFSLSVGGLNPNFGYELSVSPSMYELAEGTGFIYTLIPDIYDIGAQLSYKGPESWGNLQVNLSMVGGNGLQADNDSRRDFVGSVRASTNKELPLRLSGGISYYRGSMYQGTDRVLKMQGNKFVADVNESHVGDYAKREYFNAHAQLAFNSSIGLTQLRSEYFFGTQPSAPDAFGIPIINYLPNYDTYIREFRSGYLYFLQQIGPKLPVTLWAGYSRHDPNKEVSKHEVGQNLTTEADLAYENATFGLIWHPYPGVRVQSFYEMPFNEKSNSLTQLGYHQDKKDNVFTLRLQYKF